MIPIQIIFAGPSYLVQAAWSQIDFEQFRALWINAPVERKFAMLNNYWHHLHRAAGAHGLVRTSPAMRLLDERMGLWWNFKKSYDTTIIGQMPWVGEDWGTQLDTWEKLYWETVDVVAAASGEKLREELTRRGVDPRVLSPEGAGTDIWNQGLRALDEAMLSFQKSAKSTFFWPAVGVGAVFLGFAWLISRR